VRAFARGKDGGLIVAGAGAQQIQRDTIIAVATHHQLPAVYPFRGYVTKGGLISYGRPLRTAKRRKPNGVFGP
jgi:putative ABC transport system substrate-binding protein